MGLEFDILHDTRLKMIDTIWNHSPFVTYNLFKTNDFAITIFKHKILILKRISRPVLDAESEMPGPYFYWVPSSRMCNLSPTCLIKSALCGPTKPALSVVLAWVVSIKVAPLEKVPRTLSALTCVLLGLGGFQCLPHALNGLIYRNTKTKLWIHSIKWFVNLSEIRNQKSFIQLVYI